MNFKIVNSTMMMLTEREKTDRTEIDIAMS
jgi:hypothetical protein